MGARSRSIHSCSLIDRQTWASQTNGRWLIRRPGERCGCDGKKNEAGPFSLILSSSSFLHLVVLDKLVSLPSSLPLFPKEIEGHLLICFSGKHHARKHGKTSCMRCWNVL